jgi:hypothetical protein
MASFNGISVANSDPLILDKFTVNAGPILVFPRELREDKKNWPSVMFQVEPHGNNGVEGVQNVFLPIPPGLTFSDNIQYSTIDLGLIGTAVSNVLAAANTGNIDNIGAAGAGNWSKVKSLGNVAAIESILSKFVPSLPGLADASGLVDYTNRRVISPNTNTTFQNSTIRTFSFVFKLVSKDAKDTAAIKNIDHFFRKYAYPEANKEMTILSYPPVWKIKFHNGSDRNKYIPGIWGCYLTGLSSTFNAGTNLWHKDGSPIEVDFNLTFQETRPLTRADIEWLNSNEGEHQSNENK